MSATALGALLAGTVALSLGACLERPLAKIKPRTTNVVIRPFPNRAIDKIDLLLVVDNSASMADKQNILKKAVPSMVGRLVLPDCVRRDEAGAVVERTRGTAPTTPDARPECPDGLGPEFEPIRDIHIGVITSSLGGHGSKGCATRQFENDRAWLLPRTEKRTGVPDPHGTGFLVWHPELAPNEDPATPLEGDLARLTSQLEEQIGLVGEDGCGYEAPLEAFYRFLIDPSPPKDVVLENQNGTARSRMEGTDDELLRQRAAFLRPDSLVAVLLLTDENDCSILDGEGYYPYSTSGFALAQPSSDTSTFPVATAACATNPNDPCCTTCFSKTIPEGCTDPNALAACTGAGEPRLTRELDRDNARCFDGKRRFGVDLLYPISRYVDGLTQRQIYDPRQAKLVDNPLFTGGRSPDTVFFAGIAGVPWQDLATDATRVESSPGLAFLTASELEAPFSSSGGAVGSRWDLILGRPGLDASSLDCKGTSNPACGQADVPPLDPFMIESIDPRSGTNPLTGVGPTPSPTWNSVNGHEYDNSVPYATDGQPSRDDLQYACIFPLAPYGDLVDCATAPNCDCRDEPSKERPLCRAGDGAPIEARQSWAKAYPATRVLEVLQGVGDSGIVASICPKVHEEGSADYGYNPAVRALVDRLAQVLDPPCLPRDLSLNDEGGADCIVVEARKVEDGALDCTANGREVLKPEVDAAIRRELGRSQICSNEDCSDQSVCGIQQLIKGEAAIACLNEPLGREKELEPGYCYINEELGLGNPALTASCGPSEKRRLRFVGQDTPANGTITLLACTGQTLAED